MSELLATALEAEPKRRFLDRSGHTPTLVGAGARFEGELNCAGDLSVAGEVLGNGHIKGMLSLADSGSWQGSAHCAHALIAGQIEGELVVTGKLEVRGSARIKGYITAHQLAIAEGAIIEAEINVLSTQPVQHFVEKRSG